jgi:hypothetical protein
MTSEEILQLLASVDKRPSTLARALNVSRGLMSHAINGGGSREARLKIARTIGKPPSLIWHNVSRQQIIVDDDAYYHPEFYKDN